MFLFLGAGLFTPFPPPCAFLFFFFFPLFPLAPFAYDLSHPRPILRLIRPIYSILYITIEYIHISSQDYTDPGWSDILLFPWITFSIIYRLLSYYRQLSLLDKSLSILDLFLYIRSALLSSSPPRNQPETFALRLLHQRPFQPFPPLLPLNLPADPSFFGRQEMLAIG